MTATTWQMNRANRLARELSRESIKAIDVAQFLDKLVRAVVPQMAAKVLTVEKTG